MLQTIMLYAVMLTALLFDLTKCRIPNILIVIGYMSGILSVSLTDSLWYFHLTDSLLILLILYPFFLLGAFGGGDIKLLTVASLFIGFEEALHASLLAVIIGALFSLIKILYCVVTKEDFRLSNLYIHFSLPIFLGTIITQFFGGAFLWEMF